MSKQRDAPHLFVALGIAVCFLLFSGCSGDDVATKPQVAPVPSKSIEQIREDHTDEWLAIPGVIATAIGELDGQPCITIFVERKTEKITSSIPQQLHGHAIVIESDGEFDAL